MNVFVQAPWLALIPGVVFLAFYRSFRQRQVAMAAVAWLGYAVYEFGMHRRWFCSGDCNIRVDLLIILPVLFLVSVLGGAIVVRDLLRNRAQQ